MEKIDFVILWVDGADPAWRKEKESYLPEDQRDSFVNGAVRYRDWDLLPYWFRGVEKYAPWVNRVYFVTWGHLPAWLNTDHPKLTVVNHRDFIPEKYLPTFNTNTIVLNVHRIPGLSQQFVQFNDDMFLIAPTEPEDFFKNGLPVDECVHNALVSPGAGDRFPHFLVNNMDVLNRNFSKRKSMRQNLWKHFNWRYGIGNLRTLCLLPWWGFTGFYNPHVAAPYLKSTYEEVWQKEEKVLDATCKNKFRGYNDVTEWLMRYWQLAQGKFQPRSPRFGAYYPITADNRSLDAVLSRKKEKVCCVNDETDTIDFEKTKAEILKIFQKHFPEKSQFEK